VVEGNLLLPACSQVLKGHVTYWKAAIIRPAVPGLSQSPSVDGLSGTVADLTASEPELPLGLLHKGQSRAFGTFSTPLAFIVPGGNAMPHYYFDIRDGICVTRDEEGLEFPDIEAAREDLLKALGEITKDIMPDGDRREIVGEIRDESGKPVLRSILSIKVQRL
jgi:hypothetical protein